MSQTTRKERFHRLAKALAIVLQHPATPANIAGSLQSVARIVTHYAGLPATVLVTFGREAARTDAQAAFLEFGLAFADVLADNKLPVFVWNELGDCTSEVEALLRPKNSFIAEAARLRGIVAEYGRCAGMPAHT